MYGLDAVGGYIAGDSVVVIGPGPVGLMTVQACKALGAAESCSSARARAARVGARLGADHVVNAREEDPVAAVQRPRCARRGPGDRGSGIRGRRSSASQMVKRGGKILFLAFYPGPVTFDLSAAIRDDVTLYTTRGEGAAAPCGGRSRWPRRARSAAASW